MLDGALENLKNLGHSEEYFAVNIFTADTNYHRDTNLRKCQELRLDAYIPDRHFRRRDPRYAAQRRDWLALGLAAALLAFFIALHLAGWDRIPGLLLS
jgi:hypothetical protein